MSVPPPPPTSPGLLVITATEQILDSELSGLKHVFGVSASMGQEFSHDRVLCFKISHKAAIKVLATDEVLSEDFTGENTPPTSHAL